MTEQQKLAASITELHDEKIKLETTLDAKAGQIIEFEHEIRQLEETNENQEGMIHVFQDILAADKQGNMLTSLIGEVEARNKEARALALESTELQGQVTRQESTINVLRQSVQLSERATARRDTKLVSRREQIVGLKVENHQLETKYTDLLNEKAAVKYELCNRRKQVNIQAQENDELKVKVHELEHSLESRCKRIEKIESILETRKNDIVKLTEVTKKQAEWILEFTGRVSPD